MKFGCASFVLAITVWASGSTAAAQGAAPPSPQPAPPVAAPASVRRDSQVPTPTGASRPGATAAALGPIIATGDSVAYVSAESTDHPVVFIGSDSTPYGIMGTFSNHPLGFRTNNIARMFIDTAGNVGIGTPGPGYKLDVSGDANITGTYRVNGVPISATANWAQAGNNIYYTTGNVGIGTTSPQSKFHVVLGPSEVFPPRLESSGTNTFAAGWDFYQGAVGKGYVGVPDSGAEFGTGELLLFGGVGTKVSLWANQARAVTIAVNGNVGMGTASPTAKLDVSGNAAVSGDVGIGTGSPGAKLDVRGDIRLGPSGQYRATSSEENLRIVRGTLDANGNIIVGSGFQVSHPATGQYTITFDTAFGGRPTVTATCGFADTATVTAEINSVAVGSTEIFTFRTDGLFIFHSAPFHFIAIGPR